MTTSLTLFLALVAATPPRQDTLALRHAIMVAEDSRPTGALGVEPLLQGIRSSDGVTQRLAVRALGRLERADLAESIAPLISHPDPGVRAEAVNALGQSLTRSDPGKWRKRLEARIGVERDPHVRGAIFRTLGRLALGPGEDPSRVEGVLLAATYESGGDAPEAVLAGATHGLAAFYGRTASHRSPSDGAVDRLSQLTRPGHPVLVRRQALAALANGRSVSTATLRTTIRDTDWQVRRVAVSAAAQAVPEREAIIQAGWNDPHPAVRLEALRSSVRPAVCDRLIEAAGDRVRIVALQAVDLLPHCGSAAVPTLSALARPPSNAREWHLSAHALVSLARISGPAADSTIDEFADSPIWQNRMYAAQAAAETGNLVALEDLATDRNPNVREAALTGLGRHVGHQADARYIAALGASDYQLVMTAARLLDSTPDPSGTIPALLGALERITREERETSRDPRMAILNTLATLAGPAQTSTLRSYLSDFDPAIAQRAAELVTKWTRRETTPTPRRPPPASVPTWAELTSLQDAEVALEMSDGSRVVIALYPFESPTNTARLVRMVREGRFDGLTFHRVAPNFVVQGGSPNANEYSGDGPYSRDELTFRSHLRGTVGISTRGRDTGDGQIFINLVDNIRLDHNYTIIGEVVEGMDHVDAFLEGAMITRAVVR